MLMKEVPTEISIPSNQRLREVLKNQNGKFTVRRTVRVDPPYLTVSSFVFFSEGCIRLLFMIIQKLKQILTKKKFFDPLFDPLAE